MLFEFMEYSHLFLSFYSKAMHSDLFLKQSTAKIGSKNSIAKNFDASTLNSCFIEDINVPDGTIFAPQVQFVKIWKIYNNGSITVSKYNNIIKLCLRTNKI
jgi:hypothetical protein